MILVGGFGASRYLAKWLRNNVRNPDGTTVELIRPLDPYATLDMTKCILCETNADVSPSIPRATAIVLGAVQHGVHQHEAGNTSSWGIVESRKARYNYGISVAEVYRPIIHPRHKRYIDPFTGIAMCMNRMKWLIRKVTVTWDALTTWLTIV